MSEPAFSVKPSVVEHTETHFSWLRTRLSTERTLMSWVRTSTAMIGFGFTIFQFFDKVQGTAGIGRALLPAAPRVVSLSLISIGTLALLAAIREYQMMIAYLWSYEFKDFAGIGTAPRKTPVLGVALLLTGVGIFTLVSLISRLLR